MPSQNVSSSIAPGAADSQPASTLTPVRHTWTPVVALSFGIGMLVLSEF